MKLVLLLATFVLLLCNTSVHGNYPKELDEVLDDSQLKTYGDFKNAVEKLMPQM